MSEDTLVYPSAAPHCSTRDPGGGVGSRYKGWRLVGLGICKVGGVGSGSDSSPWISCSVHLYVHFFDSVTGVWILSQSKSPAKHLGWFKPFSFSSDVG